MNTRTSGEPVDTQIFRREGQYWTIAYEGTVLRLRDTKGLRYLAHLLRRPGDSIAAQELLVAAAGTGRRTVDRLAPRALITAEPERARLAVTKCLKNAVRTIQEYDPTLGYHLRVTIRTGARCVYLPEPGRAVPWTE